MAKTDIRLLADISFSLERSHNIYTMGDSLTSAGTYQIQLASLIDSQWDFFNLGVSGNTTTQMVARITELTKGAPEYAIILGGANDLIGGVVAATIQANLQAMYTAAKTAGATVIALKCTPFKNNAGWSAGKQAVILAVNAWISSTATDVDYIIDTYTTLNDPGDTGALLAAYDSGDGLHPNTAGYNAMGTAINAGATFTLSTTVPTLTIGQNIELNQRLDTLATPSFKGLTLTSDLVMGLNNITSVGNITAAGTVGAASITASGNSTFTGIVYSLNSFQLGALGVNGTMSSGGGALKIIAGSSTPDLVFANAANPNGRLSIKNTTANILVGDITSATDNAINIFQVHGSASSQILDLRHSAPAINMLPSGATNAIINFRNNADTATRGLIDLNLGSGEMRFWGGSGGYFPTFGANGAEAWRIATTGQFSNTGAAGTGFITLAAGTTTSAQIRLNPGVAPSAPNDGDIYYINTNDRLMFFKNATASEVISASAVTTEVQVSDTTLTVTFNGTTYKLLAKA